MTGASYLGHTQWAIAPYVDPPLRLGVAEHHRGEGQPRFLQSRCAGLPERAGLDRADRQAGTGRPASAIPNPRQLARMKRALRKVPLQAADVDVAGAPVAFWRDFAGTPQRPTSSGRVPIMTVPT